MLCGGAQLLALALRSSLRLARATRKLSPWGPNQLTCYQSRLRNTPKTKTTTTTCNNIAASRVLRPLVIAHRARGLEEVALLLGGWGGAKIKIDGSAGRMNLLLLLLLFAR